MQGWQWKYCGSSSDKNTPLAGIDRIHRDLAGVIFVPSEVADGRRNDECARGNLTMFAALYGHRLTDGVAKDLHHAPTYTFIRHLQMEVLAPHCDVGFAVTFGRGKAGGCDTARRQDASAGWMHAFTAEHSQV
jgi:hypothetical protein